MITVSVPSSASTRRRRPLEPAAGRIGAAAAVVVNLDREMSPSRAMRTSSRRARVLAGVRERLGDNEVGGALDRRLRALGNRHRDGHGRRARPAASARTAASSPRSASTGGWIATREVTQLPQRFAGSGASLREQLRAPPAGRLGELLLGHAKAHAERDESRLGAIVQVALDATQLGLLHVDGAGAA